MLRAVLDEFEAVFTRAFHARMGAKLGLASWRPEDEALLDDLLKLMDANQADFTLLAPPGRCGAGASQRVRGPVHRSPRCVGMAGSPAGASGRRWQAGAGHGPGHEPGQSAVLRNHLAEQAIRAAQQGDAGEIGTLLQLLRDPYTERSGYEACGAASGLGGRHRSQLLVLSSGLRLRKRGRR